MFRKKRRRVIPPLNTTATSDISFMLLIFFLVTTSLDNDKGILRHLSPMTDENEQGEVNVEKDNLLCISLDDSDQLMCENSVVSSIQLTIIAEQFISQHPLDHVIYIQVDKNTSYDAYFSMQNAIMAAYHDLRNQIAKKKYGIGFKQCKKDQRDVIIGIFPQRISEADLTDLSYGKGGNR